jgi:hypothetical protein
MEFGMWPGISLVVAGLTIVFGGSARARVTQYAVVPNSIDGTVSIVDTAAGTASSPIAVGGQPNC